MPIEFVKERCGCPINILEIGNGVLKPAIKVGGQSAFPFLFDEGALPNPPMIAYEILDCPPIDWPDSIVKCYGDAVNDPVEWARMCVNEFGAQLLCVRLQSVHPDYGSRPVDRALDALVAITGKIGVPLIVIGCGDDERDNDIMPKVSQALEGEKCLLGIATQNNYKTLAATCLADGHSIIADSPIDINIAKQVNILISDMGVDAKRIVMHPTTTSLGYGMEYVYSIMERGRLAAFAGDKMLAMPFMVFVGAETWKTKEAREFGRMQGINWEMVTAVSLMQGGADLVVMRDPDAARSVKRYVEWAAARTSMPEMAD